MVVTGTVEKCFDYKYTISRITTLKSKYRTKVAHFT